MIPTDPESTENHKKILSTNKHMLFFTTYDRYFGLRSLLTVWHLSANDYHDMHTYTYKNMLFWSKGM